MYTTILFNKNSAIDFQRCINISDYKYMINIYPDKISIHRVYMTNIKNHIYYMQNKHKPISSIGFMKSIVRYTFIGEETMQKLCGDHDEILRVMRTDKELVGTLIEIADLLDKIENKISQLVNYDFQINDSGSSLYNKYKIVDNKYLSNEPGYNLIHLEVDGSGNPYINLIGNLIPVEFLRNDVHDDTLTINDFNFRVQEVCSVFESINKLVVGIAIDYLFGRRLKTKSAKII